LGGKRGQLVTLTDRQKHAKLINKAVASGARQDKACEVIGLSIRTLQRWRIDGAIGEDKRSTAIRPEPQNKLSAKERQCRFNLSTQHYF
jgi:putative transposase